jgi:hypothetical protein
VFAQTEADFNVGLTADGRGVVINGYTGTATNVRIPATIEDMPVREIGNNAFKGKKTITAVTFPAGLVKIGNAAFHGCFGLTTIVIPDSVIEIGENAFANDHGKMQLTTVTLPKNLATAGEYIFAGCTALKTVTIPEGITVIGAGMFAGCETLTTMKIPNSVTTIGRNAFGRASERWHQSFRDIRSSGIVSITLSDSITAIPSGLFEGCDKLTSIVIPEGVTEIKSEDRYKVSGFTGPFEGCTALASITLPSTIKKIGHDAFKRCSALTTVTIPDSVEVIEFTVSSKEPTAFVGCSKLNLRSQASIKKVGYTGDF